MLIAKQLPALWGGVSQQPAPVRDSSQCEAQVNCISSVVDGVRRRCGSEHIARLTSTQLGNTYLHTINRDVAERYVVLVTPTGIRVFDMDGTEKTVTAPLGWDYLSLATGGNPRGSYVCMTVADYTFVLNKTKVVEMAAAGADLDPPSADYWWLPRSRQWGVASPMARIGEDGGGDYRDTDGAVIDTGTGGGGATGGGTTVVTAPQQGTYSSNMAGTFTGTVQTLQDLPTTATEGQVYKVVGTNESDFQSFYVIRHNGAWYETVMPGLRNLIDATTMPHALVRQADGTFVFGPFAWEPRHAGDETTNPNPTFVGRCIRDLFFHKNRLGMCVDENVVLSRAGRYDTFYRLTVVDYLPDEVMDIGAAETKVTKMEFAVPLQGSMMLFSDQVQFKLSHNEVLTGTSVALDVSTQYPITPGVRPEPCGADIYFSTEGTGYAAIKEYFVNADGVTHDAAEVSQHVNQYIPAGVHSIKTAPEFDTVYVLTDGAPRFIYPYKFYWRTESEKAQSAWSTWAFDEGAHVRAVAPLGGYLYMVLDRADGCYLERVPMLYGPASAGLKFHVHLDRKVTLAGTYNATTDTTTFNLPYSIPEAQRQNFACILGGTYGSYEGAAMEPSEWVSGTEVRFAGNYTTGAVVLGVPYESYFTFSRQYPQNRQGESVIGGRLQLKTFSIYYTDTAFFTVEVRPYGAQSKPSLTYVTPRRPDVQGAAVLDAPVFGAGKHTVAVQANAAEASITVASASHLGFCLHSAEWEGHYFNRAQT